MAPKEIVAAIEMQEQELIRIKGMTSIYRGEIHDRRIDIYIAKNRKTIGFGLTI